MRTASKTHHNLLWRIRFSRFTAPTVIKLQYFAGYVTEKKKKLFSTPAGIFMQGDIFVANRRRLSLLARGGFEEKK